MRQRAVSSFALATWVVLGGCHVVATVLSSVDSGLPAEGGVSGLPDGALGTPARQASQDGAGEQGPDAEAVPDAGLDGAIDVLDGDAQPAADDGSDGSDGSACGVCTGGTCQSGQCACPSGLSLCGGTCVDETTDNANCGGCGVLLCSANPPSTAACTAGRCLVTLAVVNGNASTEAIAVDTTSVYWTSGSADGGSPVMKVSTGGGVATTLAQSAPGTIPAAIAVDATSVYWTETPASPVPDAGPPGNVMRLSKGGGTATPLASGQNAPCAIAVDATSIYWMNGCGLSNNGSVMKVSTGGGTPLTLASAQTFPLYGSSVTDVPVGLAVDDTSVYWTTSSGVIKVSTSGVGTATALASGQIIPSSIAVDDTSVYWTISGGFSLGGLLVSPGSVMKVPTGGGPATTLASAQDFPGGIAVDTTSVYWTDNGSVMKVSTGGGTPTVLISSQELAAAGWVLSDTANMNVAVDATSVYWIVSSYSTGFSAYAVMKLTPK